MSYTVLRGSASSCDCLLIRASSSSDTLDKANLDFNPSPNALWAGGQPPRLQLSATWNELEVKNQIWAQPETQARRSCVNYCEIPRPEPKLKHLSSFVCAWAPSCFLRQARAISSFCPRKNIEKPRKFPRSHFDEENKEKKIVDANRSNSQVKSCFLQKQIIWCSDL